MSTRKFVALLVAGIATSACEKAPDNNVATASPTSTAASTATSSGMSPNASPSSSPGAHSLVAIARSALVVTHGSLADSAGAILVRDPEVRAVAPQTNPNDATLKFTYRGPSEKTAPLSSGEVRRQAGLKLRAQNGCNLIYVMWRFEPKEELVVSVKENPGQRTHAECGAHGYRNVAGDARVHVPHVAIGEAHTISAHLDGEKLTVTLDGGSITTYSLGSTIATLVGPVGFRTDNANLDLELSAIKAAAPNDPSGAPEDE